MKELIEELRNHSAARTGYTTELIMRACDAIESQAAAIARYETTAENYDLLRAKFDKQAREIERLVSHITTDNSATLVNALAEIERYAEVVRVESSLRAAAELELATLKAHPSGVVLAALGRAFITCESGDAGYRVVIKSETLQETQQVHNWMVRLNSSPASGEPCACGGSPHTTQCLYEHFLAYSGLSDQPLLRYAYLHGADAHCEQPASAGGADERASFEAWRLDNFCGGAARLIKCSNAPDVYYYAAEQAAWRVWQARAALTAPAPNHSEQVRDD